MDFYFLDANVDPFLLISVGKLEISLKFFFDVSKFSSSPLSYLNIADKKQETNGSNLVHNLGDKMKNGRDFKEKQSDGFFFLIYHCQQGFLGTVCY